MQPFTFDPKSARFRGRNGRFLAARDVRRYVDRALIARGEKVRGLAEQLRTRGISLQEWERRMRVELKQVHLYSALAAKGGRSQLTRQDALAVGRELNRQYRFLRRLADQIQSGKQPLDGTFLTRVRLYVQAGRGSYHATRLRLMRAKGFDEESNVLHAAEHCEGAGSCVEQTRRGWVGVGELIPIGGRLCVTNCRCEIRYRNSRTGEVAA